MEAERYISITELCTHYRVENSFIYSLKDFGLVEIITFEEEEVIPEEQVKDFEKMLRLHYDLDINLEGIDAIYNLLHQIRELQEEVQQMKNRLSRWEEHK